MDQSALATTAWPTRLDPEIPARAYLRDVTHAHKIIFAILYQVPIPLSMLARQECRFQYPICYDSRAVTETIITVCTYAEYYGCTASIVPVLRKLLLDLPAVWRCIASDASTYMMLAKRLQCSKIYFAALRHLAAQAYHDKSLLLAVGEVSIELDMSEK